MSTLSANSYGKSLWDKIFFKMWLFNLSLLFLSLSLSLSLTLSISLSLSLFVHSKQYQISTCHWRTYISTVPYIFLYIVVTYMYFSLQSSLRNKIYPCHYRTYVSKVLYLGTEVPERHDLTLFPTVNDLKNQIHQAMVDVENGTLVVTSPQVNWCTLSL